MLNNNKRFSSCMTIFVSLWLFLLRSISEVLNNKHRMKSILKKGLIAGFIAIAITTAPQIAAAQTPKVGEKVNVTFDKEDLKTFVSINKKMSAEQMKAQQDIMSAMQVVGITPQRFGELFAEESKTDKVSATGEELKKYKMAKDRVSSIQEAFGEKMKTAILAAGMDPVHFQKITMAYTQNPEVKKQVDELLQEQ